MNIHERSDNTAFFLTYSEWEWAMIRPGGRGQCFVLAMFTRAKMRQSEQYGCRAVSPPLDEHSPWINFLFYLEDLVLEIKRVCRKKSYFGWKCWMT